SDRATAAAEQFRGDMSMRPGLEPASGLGREQSALQASQVDPAKGSLSVHLPVGPVAQGIAVHTPEPRQALLEPYTEPPSEIGTWISSLRTSWFPRLIRSVLPGARSIGCYTLLEMGIQIRRLFLCRCSRIR